MKDTIGRSLNRLQRQFLGFSTGQKVVAVIGTGALLLAGFMVFKWASTPSYAPLYSNMSASDASAVIDQLDSKGVPYKITGGGSTVMVPRDQVYTTRIQLSGEGLPTSSDGGYSILDNQGLSTSQFQEQTDFKRAMEGELSKTIESMDDVQTAVVHLALPEKQVFADQQDPATASVLLQTRPGSTLGPEQVQAVVNLVASSIDGLDPDKVTVADSTGHVLSAPSGSSAAVASTRTQQVDAVQSELHDRLQAMLDRVVGPGNSTVQVTAALSFDQAVTDTTTYTKPDQVPPLSSTTSTETYQGPASGSGATGVVGPDGQMDTSLTGTAGGDSSYEKKQQVEDNALDTRVEHRETAPGAIESLHVGVVLDTATTRNIAPNDIRDLVAAAVGIKRARGDTVQVTSLPFDRSAEEAASKELAAAAARDASDQKWTMIRNGALGVLVVLMLLLAWFKARRHAKARENATTYVVEQLRQERAHAALPVEAAPATLALEQAEHDRTNDVREELNALVERQPEDVAALLRGWLVERP
jgi:flagellar M-ring protein FliF